MTQYLASWVSPIAHASRELLRREDDPGYRHLIVGRTVYHYVLFVEPRLNNQRALSAPLWTSQFLNLMQIAKLGCLIGVTEQALARLPSGEFSKLAEVQPSSSDHNGAMMELGWLCRTIISAWLCAEFGERQPEGASRLNQDFSELLHRFMQIELFDRLGDCQSRRTSLAELTELVGEKDLAELLSGSGTSPLTSELLAYWCPLWNRSAILFESPFDGASNLDQVVVRNNDRRSAQR